MVEREALGGRWTLWTFDGSNSPFATPTTVAGILGDGQLWILDTHTGPASMVDVRAWAEESGHARWWVVNGHEDWDHVWGNAAFPEASIVAERSCARFLAEDFMWVHGLKAWGDAAAGEVIRRAPDLAFEGRLSWEAEGVALVHRPGHTKGSIHVWDEREGIVFVGDNLEEPLPYLQSHDLAAYVASLEALRAAAPEVVVCSHSGRVATDLVDRTLVYLEGILAGRPRLPEGTEAAAIHRQNERNLLVSRYEECCRRAWGQAFTMETYVEAVEAIAVEELRAFEGALSSLAEAEGPPSREG